MSEADLAQALHLLNSDEIQGKLAASGRPGRGGGQDPRPDGDKVDELFLGPWAASRRRNSATWRWPTSPNAANKKAAYENILSALLNTKEFVFNK